MRVKFSSRQAASKQILRIFFAVATALSFLSGCIPERHEWRQKLTVVVETPAGEVSGSSVVQVAATHYGQLPATGTEVEYNIRGEATVVEVAPGQYLFVLLGGSEELFYRVARERFKGLSREEWLRKIPIQSEVAIIAAEDAPMMVTFVNIDEPATLKELDPADLSDGFGMGYEINTIRLEITSDPLTYGRIDQVLPPTFFRAWGTSKQEAVDNGTMDQLFRTLLGRLSRSDFVRE